MQKFCKIMLFSFVLSYKYDIILKTKYIDEINIDSQSVLIVAEGLTMLIQNKQ